VQIDATATVQLICGAFSAYSCDKTHTPPYIDTYPPVPISPLFVCATMKWLSEVRFDKQLSPTADTTVVQAAMAINSAPMLQMLLESGEGMEARRPHSLDLSSLPLV
jgi:hypothetical protein